MFYIPIISYFLKKEKPAPLLFAKGAGIFLFCLYQCVNRKVNRNTRLRIAVTGLISLILPVQSLMIV